MKIALIFCFVVLGASVFGQIQKKSSDFGEVTVGGGQSRGSFSFSYLHNWHLDMKQKLSVGLGVRATSFFGANLHYITAPAQLTSGSTSPLIFFKENISENLDTILIKSSQVNAVNLMINIDYCFSNSIVVGFNIDAIGFSFGGSQRANFMSGYVGKNTTATPTPFNVLLISDNDRGSLNSELYIRIALRKGWAIKGAGQFLFTEYTTETKVQQYPSANDRFRNKSLLFGIGLSKKI
jgi:hypothetical protein